MSRLYVVGLGPGGEGAMTAACLDALEEADVLVGYTGYVERIAPRYPHKRTLHTPMTREAERCHEALRLACAGERVAVVCSGDAGVYGMAGLIYELSAGYPPVEIEVIPGVTAALAGAALLGAPLTHDFAVVSLSDLLTPWELIEKRLECAAQADFCVALYNPASKTRRDHLRKACGVLLRHKAPDTVCGLVRNVGREGERAAVTTLARLGGEAADMFTTVFVGNSRTRLINGKMVTPRGYRLE